MRKIETNKTTGEATTFIEQDDLLIDNTTTNGRDGINAYFNDGAYTLTDEDRDSIVTEANRRIAAKHAARIADLTATPYEEDGEADQDAADFKGETHDAALEEVVGEFEAGKRFN